MMLLLGGVVVLLQVLQPDVAADDAKMLADLRAGKLMGNELIAAGQRCNELELSRAFAAWFGAEKDPDKMRAVAGLLVRYRSADPQYYSYLEEKAFQAVNSDAPIIYVLDSAGQGIRGQRNPAFDQWCESHGTDLFIESFTARFLR